MAKASSKKVVAAPPQAAPSNFNTELMARLVRGRQGNDAYFEYHPVQMVAALVSEGLVEQNDAMKDDNGYLATRASDKGMQHFLAAGVPVAPTPVTERMPASSSSKFAIDDDIPLPDVKRNFGGATREPTYPFDALPAPVSGRPPASFHVPVTAEMENPARAIGSAVSGQNRKWARPTGQKQFVEEFVYQTGADGKRMKQDGHYVKMIDGFGNPVKRTVEIDVTVQEREFTIRSVDANDPRGPGARVFRIK